MTRKTMVLFLVLLFTAVTQISAQVERREEGNLVIENIPDIPESVIDRMIQYRNARSARFRGWLPSGEGMLMSTRFGETSQIHIIKKPGGARTQITFFNEPVSSTALCPDKSKNGFLFMKDVGGSEFFQIFWFDMENGTSKMITDGKSRFGILNWSNKGDKFTYYSTRRNGRDWDVYLASIDDPEKGKPVLEKSGVWAAVDWSPDDSKLMIMNYVSANESYYHILDIASGKLEQINPSDEKISYGSAIFDKNGNGVYLTSDEGTEFSHLRYYDLKSKKTTVLTKDIPWDIGDMELSKDGSKLAFTANEDGVGTLYMMDTKSRKYEKVRGIPVGQVYSLDFSHDGKHLGFVNNNHKTPGDIYSLELGTGKLTRWTYSEVGGLNTEEFSATELIHYKTFDEVDGKKREIPAFITRPKNKKGPLPVVIDIHGGPEAQAQPGFSSTLQFWANELGIAVIEPNVRGSSGYGKSYLQLDNGFKREESVKDIGALLDWIEEQPDLDASSVCVFGGSYGGYMVLASMVNYNDRIKCGVDIVGISNFVTFLENTKPYRQDLRRVEYGDERDPDMREFQMKISPTTNAHKITKPLFIVQGLNDPRVPASEAEQILAKVRENGGEAWYLLAKDEGHGFRKKQNRDYFNYSVVMFFEEYLLK